MSSKPTGPKPVAMKPPSVVSRFYLRTAAIDADEGSKLRLPLSVLNEIGWKPGEQLSGTAMRTGDRAGNRLVITIERT